MHWKDYLKDLFMTYRQEFDKLDDEEKALVQLNITFSEPCQIEVLEFLKPRCQALVVIFYNDSPDMEVAVHDGIAISPERFVEELARKNEKWKRFNRQQLQNIIQAIRNYSKGKHWTWSSISERACIYTKRDFKDLSHDEFVSVKMNQAFEQINMKKRDKMMENVVPIPIDQIPKDEGQALISFSLPFEVVDDGDYNVSIQGHIAKVSIRRVSAEGHFEKLTGLRVVKSGGASVRLTGDTRGISIISQVEILIPYVPDEIYFLQIILEYLNRLLDVWRAATGKFWLKESISDRDIVLMRWEKRPSSGKGRRGTFAFGLPRQIKLPLHVQVREASDVRSQINQYLIDETKIQLFETLGLNALNHYVERRFDLAIIETNIALEDYTRRLLARCLSEKGLSKEEISRKLNKYDTFHKMLDRGLKDAAGRSLRENVELWKDFERMRTIRKNTIHPFVKKPSYKDATVVMNTAARIAQWISRK